MTHNVRLTVLKGGRNTKTTIKNVTLSLVPDSLSPLPVNVRVFEEDTHLVLTVDPVMRYTGEHPIRLMTEVLETKPNNPGSIIANKNSWYAIIHDLDSEPTWRPEWIKQAYRALLILGEQKRIRKTGLPLLGSVHGDFAAAKSMNILIQEIKSLSFQHLKKILIIVPQKDCEKLRQHLREQTK